MSGPVADGREQFEDAAIEMGIDVEFIFATLSRQHEGWQLWLTTRLERDPRISPYVRNMLQVQQRLWDQLALLRPSWGDNQIAADHDEALALNTALAA